MVTFPRHCRPPITLTRRSADVGGLVQWEFTKPVSVMPPAVRSQALSLLAAEFERLALELRDELATSEEPSP
ncbi:MAG: hypothetical protein NT169_22445 [Chloroflexi bacterium]|nr:hypothetical protein [Chloroflexota bacterium]